MGIARIFDGVAANFIEGQSSPDYRTTQKLTVAGWANVDAVGALFTGLAYNNTPGIGGFFFYLHTDSKLRLQAENDSSGEVINCSDAISGSIVGVYRFYAATWDQAGGEVKFYSGLTANDVVQIGNTEVPVEGFGVTVSSQPHYLGARNNDGVRDGTFAGKMHGWGLWRTILSLSQLKTFASCTPVEQGEAIYIYEMIGDSPEPTSSTLYTTDGIIHGSVPTVDEDTGCDSATPPVIPGGPDPDPDDRPGDTIPVIPPGLIREFSKIFPKPPDQRPMQDPDRSTQQQGSKGKPDVRLRPERSVYINREWKHWFHLIWLALRGGPDSQQNALLTMVQVLQHHHERHLIEGDDAFGPDDVIAALVFRILEGGDTALTVGDLVDGEFLKRVGTTIVSDTPTTGTVMDAVRVIRTTNQVIGTGAVTPISFDTETYDQGSGLWTIGAPTRITIVEPGVYSFSGVIRWDANATGERSALTRVNGSTLVSAGHIGNPAAGNDCTTWTAGDINLAAADYLELCGFQNSGGNLNAQAQASYANWFAVHRVR